MFGRVSRSAYVCLRCQTQSLQRTSKWQPWKDTTHPPVLRRQYASAAAAAVRLVEDDTIEEDAGTSHHVTSGDAGSFSGDSPAMSDRSTIGSTTDAPYETLPPRKRKKNAAYRSWRPSTRLGVDALGKPAEVLILRDRDRVIPTVPSEELNEQQPSLQASLDAENEPLTTERLNDVLAQIRSGVGKERGQLEHEEWIKLRKRLLKSFSTGQLSRFLLSVKPALNELGSKPALPVTKDALVRLLVEDVWAYILPSEVKTKSKGGRVSKLTFKITDLAQVDYLMSGDPSPLQELSQKYGTVVKVWRKERKITVSGPIEFCHQTLNSLKQFMDQLETTVLPFTGNLALFKDPCVAPKLPSFVKSLSPRHPTTTLVNSPDTDSFQIVRRKQQKSSRALERDIRLAAWVAPETKFWKQWPANEKVSPVAFPATLDLPWVYRQLNWTRNLASAAKVNASKRVPIDFEGTLQSIGRFQKMLIAPRESRTNRNHLRSELFAVFGQALFQSDKPISHERIPKTAPESNHNSLLTTAHNVKGGSKPGADQLPALHGPNLVTDIPFLTQFMTSLQPWKDPNGKNDLGEKSNLILRADLIPSKGKAGVELSRLPRFEVVLKGRISRDGQLEVQPVRVTAIHQQNAYYLLCPTQETDIKLVHQLKQDLIYPGMTEPSAPQTVAFRHVLANYLRRSSFSYDSGWMFGSFVDLPIDSPLLAGQTAPQSKEDRKPKSGPRPHDSQSSGKIDVAGARIPQPASEHDNLPTFRYMLKSVDVLDVDSRAVPLNPAFGAEKGANWCLDHIVARAGESSRHELRLGERSILREPSMEEADARVLLQTALSVVDRLKDGEALALHRTAKTN